eukprot:1159514-Pelagomonas_calceolata.AAC.2
MTRAFSPKCFVATYCPEHSKLNRNLFEHKRVSKALRGKEDIPWQPGGMSPELRTDAKGFRRLSWVDGSARCELSHPTSSSRPDPSTMQAVHLRADVQATSLANKLYLL